MISTKLRYQLSSMLFGSLLLLTNQVAIGNQTVSTAEGTAAENKPVRVKTLPNGTWVDQFGAIHGSPKGQMKSSPKRLTGGVPLVRVKTLPDGSWIDQNGAQHGPSRRANIKLSGKRLTGGVPAASPIKLSNPLRKPKMEGVKPSAAWNGTWVRPEAKLMLSANTKVVGVEKGSSSATNSWTASYDSTTLTSPTSATGKFTGRYQDQDKSIPYSGTLTMTLTGDKQLRAVLTIKNATPTWKAGVTPYQSAVHVGAILDSTYTKQ